MTAKSVFNSPSEIAVRILVILNAFGAPMDIQQLVYFDYLTLHYGDIDKEYVSLHPANPFHAVEYVVKRRSIQNGLDLGISKGLIKVEYSSSLGIRYEASPISSLLMEYLESAYFNSLCNFAEMVCRKFKNFTQSELSGYFREHVGDWKGEFEKEALFRGE